LVVIIGTSGERARDSERDGCGRGRVRRRRVGRAPGMFDSLGVKVPYPTWWRWRI